MTKEAATNLCAFIFCSIGAWESNHLVVAIPAMATAVMTGSRFVYLQEQESEEGNGE